MSLPRWVVALLRRLAPTDRAEDLLGDLEEVHRDRVARHGKWVAGLRTALEALETARALIGSRLRPGPEKRGAGLPAPKRTVPISWIDLKLGVRVLRKYPLLTGVSIVPMAMAIAAAGGVYAVTANILHPRLPFPDGDRIVGIEDWSAATQSPEAPLLHDFAIWRGELTSVADVGAFETYRPNLILDRGRSEPLHGSRISASGFRVTGVPPLLGRPLLDADERPGAPDVAVIGYELWQTSFGGDDGVLGKTVRLGESSAVVVGVMPPGFVFPYNDEIWVPLRGNEQEWAPFEGPQIFVFGRLRDGVAMTDAQAELEVLGRRAAAEDPEAYRGIRPRIVPYGVNVWGGPTLALRGVRVVLVLLLLVVCSTVGVLVFVRNLSREEEVAMRFFLGASRGRIVAQLFTEALVLASGASLLGVILMSPGLRWAYAAAMSASAGEGGVPFWVHPQVARGTLVFLASLTLLSAGFAGLLPALTLTRWRGRSPLPGRASGGGTFRIGTKGTLAIAGQTALTVGLLAFVGGLWPGMIGSMVDTTARPAGSYLAATFRPGEVPATNEEKDRVLRRVLESSRSVSERLVGDPAVEGVTLASTLPGQHARRREIEVEGRVVEGDLTRARLAWVDTAYFGLLGIPLLTGRTFRAEDLTGDASSPSVAIVTRSFAKHWFGDRSPLGERVRFRGAITAFSGDPAQHPWAEIVGVVSDAGMSARHPGHPRGLYLPLRTGTYPMMMAVRTTRNPASVSARLRGVGAAVDPWLRLGGIATLKSLVDSARAGWRAIYAVVLLATLTALALSLSALYAVVSFLVEKRTREIGIRIALGGRPSRVVGGILSQALRQIGIGVGVGVALMLGLRVVTLTPLSWGMLLVVSGAAVAAGFAASLVPALRAAGVEPTVAIRSER